MTTASSFDMGSLPVRMLCRKSDGKPLNDVELLKRAIKMSDDYKAKHGKPISIPPKFLQWAKEAVDYCDKGGNIADYKQQTILQTIPDYDIVCENTEKQNQRAAKNGDFDTRTEKRIIKG